MKKILIPVALLFAGFKVSAQSTDVRTFSFKLGVKMPVTLTFNNPDGATKTGLMEVGSIDGNGNVTAINTTGLNYSLPSITATNPFELRAKLASPFWRREDGTDTNIGAGETDEKSMVVKLGLKTSIGTEEGTDLQLATKNRITLSSTGMSLLAYSDNATTTNKGAHISYMVTPKGIKADDLKDRVNMVVTYALYAK